MRPLDTPADMSADQRLREIAAILARGVVRLNSLPTSENSPESDDRRLEVPDETVLSVTRG